MIKDFFIFCSGASQPLLARCPTDHSKYAGLGGAIFFTGLFAAIAAGYALFTVFDNVWLALIFGLVWGLMIFNLDRYIISSMRKEASFGREFVFALPRMVLAVIISIVISTPLELRIFQKEIAPELAIMEQEAYAKQEHEVRTRFEASEKKLLQQLSQYYERIDVYRNKRDDLRREAQAEADGTGGSRVKNLGPIYKLKKADADKAEVALNEIISETQPSIDEVRKQMLRLDSARSATLGTLQFARRDGPAARMEALDRISAASPAIQWASWFILLLIIAIETTPIFIKLMTRKGPYDNMIAVEEHRFTVDAIEETGQLNSNARRRVQEWAIQEKEFGNERLDSALKKL